MHKKDREAKDDAIYKFDLVIKMCVEDIWNKHANKDGLMEKQQIRMFVRTLLCDMGD